MAFRNLLGEIILQYKTVNVNHVCITTKSCALQVLSETAQKNVKRNVKCLEPCLRQFASAFDKHENMTVSMPHFFRLLITFANCLDPDQDRHYVGPDLGPNRLTL